MFVQIYIYVHVLRCSYYHMYAVMETTPAHCQGDQPVAFPSTHSTVALMTLKNCPVMIKVTWTCPADSLTR